MLLKIINEKETELKPWRLILVKIDDKKEIELERWRLIHVKIIHEKVIEKDVEGKTRENWR